MGIPKIKIYRLDENYDQSKDNDINSLSQDQMLPISKKELNPIYAQQMVGVKLRGDSRMVVQSDWKIKSLALTLEEDTGIYKTLDMCAQGIVLGKGNFRVFLNRRKPSEASSSSEFSSSSSSQQSFEECSQENGWFQIDRKFWDYEIKTVKKYYNGSSYQSIPSDNVIPNDCQSFHNIDYITFKIGNVILESNVLFQDGYSNYVPIYSVSDALSENRIIIMYKTYRQLMDYALQESSSSNYFFDTDKTLSGIKQIKYDPNVIQQIISGGKGINSEYSKFRVPFGNIYNGNKHGRCFTYGVEGSLTHDTINKKKNDYKEGQSVKNNSYMDYFQGNYLYKRRILPLRYLVAQVEDLYSSSSDWHFTPNYYISGRSINFECDGNWVYQGLLKPVLMQRIKTEQGNFIFKKLQENVQYSYYYNNDTSNNGIGIYNCTFLNSFYNIGQNSYCPKEVFLFYNRVDDSLGNIFDFNYDYHNFFKNDLPISVINPWENTIFGAYGYANRGNLILNQNYAKLIKSNKIYKKIQKLAVAEGFGYDSNRDFQLNRNENQISFTISDLEEDERELGYRIYFDGIKVFDNMNTSASSSSSSQEELSSDFDFQIGVVGNNVTFTITRKENNGQSSSSSSSQVSFPTDLMVVYYKYTDIEFNGSNNPVFLGYRIPCYEKVKTSKLFVSSFPNWVKGHLENDLDVFVGNKQYSGVTLSSGQTKAVYPCYQQDGWFPSYSDGYVQFSDQITQVDYFDLFNFKLFENNINPNEGNEEDWSDMADIGTLPNYINFESSIKYELYFVKVKYNVAYYDGIYSVVRGRLSNYSVKNNENHYALLEDDDFLDSVGKKWIVREDENIKMLFQSNRVILPQIYNVNQSQNANLLTQRNIQQGQIFRLNTNSDRINAISFSLADGSSYNTMVLCLNPNVDTTGIVDNYLQSRDQDDVLILVRIKNGIFKVFNYENDFINLSDLFEFEFGEEDLNPAWKSIQPFDDYYENKSLGFVQQQSDRYYMYSNEKWGYDVFIEVFSYRYKTNVDSEGNKIVDNVEYIVYKIDK